MECAVATSEHEVPRVEEPSALGLFDLVLRGQDQLSSLLRHDPALPSLTHGVEVGHEHLTNNDVQRESSEQAVERRLRANVVVAFEGAREVVCCLS